MGGVKMARNVKISSKAPSPGITEGKQAEGALKRLDEFAKTVFNSINDAVSLIDVHDFRIVGVNSALLKQLRLKEEEVVGKTCYQVTHDRSEPCAGPEHICPLLDAVATGEQSVAEHVHCGADGEETYVEVSISPVKDKNGKVTQVVCVSKDISERKRAGEGLRESEEKLRNLFESVSGGIFALDLNGIYTEVNTRMVEMHGFSSRGDLLGRSGFELVVPRDLERRWLRCRKRWNRAWFRRLNWVPAGSMARNSPSK